MIVRRAEDGAVLLITQPAHARLARKVMERCEPLAHHPRRARILRAIAEHDNGWQEEDDAPESDPSTGSVVDFIHIAVPVRQRVWPRSVARLEDDPWAAALVAHHAITVYERYRSESEWDQFFLTMEALRETMLARADVAASELDADYVYLRLADLISLCFCTGSPAEQRIAEWSVQWIDPAVLVSPDPFDGREIQMEITATRVRLDDLRSSRELRDQLEGAETVVLSGSVKARPAS
jgi:hypothetical protein